MNTYLTRESWLQAAAAHLRAIFAAKNFVVPECQVSCVFTGTSVGAAALPLVRWVLPGAQVRP